MRPAKLKMLLVHKGIEELFALHRADAQASGREVEHVDYAVQMRREWDEMGELAPQPLLTGNDLLEMGVAQGPIYKILLEKVREAQLDRVIVDKEGAVAMARRLLEEARNPLDPSSL